MGQANRIGTTASLHSCTILPLSWFGGYIMKAQFVNEREPDCCCSSVAQFLMADVRRIVDLCSVS